MTSRLKDIADELRSIAQNDYMIDSHYLPVGTDLMVVADTLERISDAELGSDFAKGCDVVTQPQRKVDDNG